MSAFSLFSINLAFVLYQSFVFAKCVHDVLSLYYLISLLFVQSRENKHIFLYLIIQEKKHHCLRDCIDSDPHELWCCFILIWVKYFHRDHTFTDLMKSSFNLSLV